MKLKSTLFLLLFSWFGVSYTVGQGSSEAISYLNSMYEPISDLKNENWSYLKAIVRGKNSRKVDGKRKSLIKEIGKVSKKIEMVPVYQSETILKPSIMNYLMVSKAVMTEDFAKLMDMEDIAEQSYDKMEAYILAKEKAKVKLDSANSQMEKAKRQFCDKFGITLVETEMDKRSKQIEKASSAVSYYNKIYLIFFKVFIQEMFVFKSLEEMDFAGMEQNSSTLALFVDEGMEKLTELGNFNSDPSLLTAARNMLKFYKSEAVRDFPIYIDYLSKIETYKKLHTAFEGKSERDLTPQERNQIEKMNRDVKKLNIKVTNTINRSKMQRDRWFNTWTFQVEKFYDKHTF